MKNIIPLAALMAALFFVGCQKFDGNQDSKLYVYLTDNAIPADEVNVEIQGVKVKYKGTVEPASSTNPGSSEDWVWLDVNEGVYNLLNFTNGRKTLLAVGGVPGANIKEMRFVLGKNNTIKFDGQTYPMTLEAGNEFGYKIDVVKKMGIPRDSITIDFDAALSVIEVGVHQYKLVPHLAVK
ncbi:MAG: DUF4382 domain-containing protein [Chitinophagaceae bacterium]|nr:DUF4382 domain-containing protein [Chitinophagaceae bacterium]